MPAQRPSATEIIDRAFNNAHNPLTPQRIECMHVGKFTVEISTGEGMDKQPVFGVSVVQYTNTSKPIQIRHDLKEMLTSEQAARDYIATLRNKA